jgi:hypothetical protein
MEWMGEMIDKAPLQRAIDGATTPVYPSSFRDVGEGYKEKYGARGWIGELAMKMSGATSKHGKEYLAARRSIERASTGQYKAPSARYAPGLASAGKTLDPIRREVPKEGLTFVLKFNAPEDKGHRPRERSTPESGPDVIHLDYKTATEFIAMPSYDFLFDEWFDGGGDAYGEDGDYEAENVSVVAY